MKSDPIHAGLLYYREVIVIISAIRKRVFIGLKTGWMIDKMNIKTQNLGTLSVKGYLRDKSIFSHEVTLDASLVNFSFWRKNDVSFSRYLDFCDFVKSANFKICDVIKDIAT